MDRGLIGFRVSTTGNLRNANPIQRRRVLHKTVAPSLLPAPIRTSTNTTAYGYDLGPVSSHVHCGTLSRACFRLSAGLILVESQPENRALSQFFTDHDYICHSSVGVGFCGCGWLVLADEDAPRPEDSDKTQSWTGNSFWAWDHVS